MTHHKFGRIQLHNIHDRGNLVALCKICHFAFDSDEWTFIPEDTTNWTQKIEATPQVIQEYNSQRNILFRRLLLVPDPDSEAFQDNYYKSAFTDSPTKIWPGDPGVVIVRPPPFPSDPTAELQKTLDDFRTLQKLWLRYKSPHSEEECPICHGNIDGKQGKETDLDDKNDDEDDNGNEDDGEEDEKGDEDISSSRKSRKGTSKRQPDSTGQQPSLQDLDTKKSIQANKHRKMPKNTERDWMTSAPYDESIPYSHRYGYTWAGTTSNELMKLWQVYRKPADE